MALLKNSHPDSPDDMNKVNQSFDFPVVKKGWDTKTVSHYIHALIDKHDEELEVLANRVTQLQAEESQATEEYRQQILTLQQSKESLELQLASSVDTTDEKTDVLIGRIAQLEAENNQLKQAGTDDPELQKQLILLQEKESKIQGDLGDISTSLNNAVESNSLLEESNNALSAENSRLKQELDDIRNAHVVEQRESQKMGAIAARLTEALEAEKARNEEEMAQALSEAQTQADDILRQAQAEADNITQSAVKELRTQIDEVRERAELISKQREEDGLKIEALFQQSNDEAENVIEDVRAVIEKSLFDVVQQHRDNIAQLREEKEVVANELLNLDIQRQDILKRLHTGLDAPEEFVAPDPVVEEPQIPVVKEEPVKDMFSTDEVEQPVVEDTVTEPVEEIEEELTVVGEVQDMFSPVEEEANVSEETVEEVTVEETEVEEVVQEADDEESDFELNFFTEEDD